METPGRPRDFSTSGAVEVADDEDDNLVDDSGGDTKSDVVGNDGNESAGEGEVPVVPDIDVSGLGGVGRAA